ncbi:MAG: hypothetical protein ACR2GR_01730 [Rhodothermales bacterium]
MYRISRFLPLLFLMTLLSIATSGCDLFGGGDDDEDTSGVEGGWSGTLATTEDSFTFAFNLADDNGQLSGDGTITSGGLSDGITVTGTYSEPSVHLRFSDGLDQLDFNGALLAGENTMVGTLGNVDIVFNRQNGGSNAKRTPPNDISGISTPSRTLLDSLKDTL